MHFGGCIHLLDDVSNIRCLKTNKQYKIKINMNAAILNNIIGQNMFLFRVERKDFMRLPYFTSHLVIRPYGSKTSSMSLTLVDLLNLPIKSWPSARRDIFLFFLVKCPDEMIRCETARPRVNSDHLQNKTRTVHKGNRVE